MKSMIIILALSLNLASCAHKAKKDDTNQRRAELHYAHGTEKLMAQEYTEALDHLIKANEAYPNHSPTLNNLGMAYYFKNEMGRAEQAFRQALRADARNSDARNNLASLYFHLDRLDEARKEYEIVQKDLVYLHQYRVKYNLALIYLKENNRARAIELLKAASAEREDYCAANFQLGTLYRQARQFQEAGDWFKKAGDGTCYGEPAPHYQLAEIYEITNRHELAKLKYEDIAERFAQTSYGPAARERIKTLEKTIQVKEELSRNRTPNSSQQIFSTPKF